MGWRSDLRQTTLSSSRFDRTAIAEIACHHAISQYVWAIGDGVTLVVVMTQISRISVLGPLFEFAFRPIWTYLRTTNEDLGVPSGSRIHTEPARRGDTTQGLGRRRLWQRIEIRIGSFHIATSSFGSWLLTYNDLQEMKTFMRNNIICIQRPGYSICEPDTTAWCMTSIFALTI